MVREATGFDPELVGLLERTLRKPGSIEVREEIVRGVRTSGRAMTSSTHCSSVSMNGSISRISYERPTTTRSRRSFLGHPWIQKWGRSSTGSRRPPPKPDRAETEEDEQRMVAARPWVFRGLAFDSR